MKSPRICLVLVMLVLAGAKPDSAPGTVHLAHGDILVIDAELGTERTPFGGGGALIRIDRLTGAREIISDFGDAAQGVRGFDPDLVAVDRAGNIYVGDGFIGFTNNVPTDFIGVIFRVDPTTGMRTVLSDFTDPDQGVTNFRPEDLVIDNSGDLVVSALGKLSPDAQGKVLLFRVDAQTGQRTVISDLSDPNQGPSDLFATGLDVAPSGEIFFVDPDAGTVLDACAFSHCGALFRVDATAGMRTLVSDFGSLSQGPLGEAPLDVKVDDANGDVLVIDNFAGTNGFGAVFEVDPATGVRTMVTDFGNVAQGPRGIHQIELTIDPVSTNLFYSDPGGFQTEKGGLIMIDRSTGIRQVLSDYDDANLGPLTKAPVNSVVFIDSVAPPAPTLVSPADNALVNQQAVTLDWTDVYDQSSPVEYDVFVYNTPNPDDISDVIASHMGLASSEVAVTVGDGTYYWELRARDASGNASAFTPLASFTVDTTPPATQLVGAEDIQGDPILAGSSIPLTDIRFAFTGTDNLAVAGFQCALDLAVFSSCTSGTLYTGLPLGAHTFRVRAVDTAGNADPTPAIFTWTIVSPAQAAQNLSQMLLDLNLPAQITNPLLGHLTQLEEILNDGNPTNDVSGCNMLGAFVTFVNERSEKGDISAANAAALVESAGDIAYVLGCG